MQECWLQRSARVKQVNQFLENYPTMSYAIIGLYEDNERFREDLGSDRFESIVGAKKTYMLAVGLEENINLLIDNYDEFKAEMLKLADQARQGLHQMELVARMRARLLLN